MAAILSHEAKKHEDEDVMPITEKREGVSVSDSITEQPDCSHQFLTSRFLVLATTSHL